MQGYSFVSNPANGLQRSYRLLLQRSWECSPETALQKHGERAWSERLCRSQVSIKWVCNDNFSYWHSAWQHLDNPLNDGRILGVVLLQACIIVALRGKRLFTRRSMDGVLSRA